MANENFRDVYNRSLEGEMNAALGQRLKPREVRGSYGAPGAGGEEMLKLLELLSGPGIADISARYINRMANGKFAHLYDFNPPGSPYKAAKIQDALKMHETQSGMERDVYETAHSAIDKAIEGEDTKSLVNYLISGMTGLPGAGNIVNSIFGTEEDPYAGTQYDLPRETQLGVSDDPSSGPGVKYEGSYPSREGKEEVNILTPDFYLDLSSRKDKDEILKRNPDLRWTINDMEENFKRATGKDLEKTLSEVKNDPNHPLKHSTDRLFERREHTVPGRYEGPMTQMLNNVLSKLEEQMASPSKFSQFGLRPMGPSGPEQVLAEGEPGAPFSLLGHILAGKYPGIDVK